MEKSTVGIQSAALAAASELMKQATEASVSWNKEVESIKKANNAKIDAIKQEIASANSAHQLMIGKLNAAHGDSVRSLNKKIDELNKTMNAQLVDLEAKSGPLVDSKVVQGTVKTADRVASKSIGFLGKGFGYIRERFEQGAQS